MTTSEHAAPRQSSPIRFTLWDYSTIDGGGHVVISRPDRCQHEFGPVAGVFCTSARYTSLSVDCVDAAYRAEWTVAIDVRYCACGCLRDAGAAPAYVIRESGTPVTYHGSLTELRGPAYYCGPCWCDSADGPDGLVPDCGKFELETDRGQIIKHVRADSFSAR